MVKASSPPSSRPPVGLRIAKAGHRRLRSRVTTFGISTFGAAFPNALNCSGLRNIAEHPEQA